MIILFFFIYIVLYLILYYFTLDKINRKSLYYFLHNSNINLKTSVNIPFEKKKIHIINLLKIIFFKDRIYLDHLNEGGFYSFYIAHFYPKLYKLLNNKLYWNEIFIENNIATPKVIAYIKNKKLKILSKINNNKNYISKPIDGMLGLEIFKLKGHQILNSKLNDVIFQEYIENNCFENNTVSFRFITLYNGKVFNLFQLSKKKSVTSNGGKMLICKPVKCNQLPEYQNEELKKIFRKLSKLHKNKYNNIFSIGWDIIISCSDNNIKTLCLEGNICHTVWRYKDKIDKKLIQKYKKLCTKFLEKKNLI